MAYVQPTDVVVGDPVEAATANVQNAALANLNSRTSGIEKLVLPNGSFEDDLDLDGEPDGWTVTNEGTGATHEIDSTDRADGLKSLKCTVNATTGYVVALNDTQLPVYPGARVVFGFSTQSTVATCRIRANIRWLNSAKTLISEVSAFDSAANNPAAWQHYDGIQVSLVAPATAAWMEFKLIAGDGTVAGVVHFDAVQPRIYHGFVPVDMTAVAALLSSALTTNLTLTLPNSIVGEERPNMAVLHVLVEYNSGTMSGTAEMIFRSESGGINGTRYYFDDTLPEVFNHGPMPCAYAPTRLRDKTFNVFEQTLTGANNMSVRRIYLAGYYV